MSDIAAPSSAPAASTSAPSSGSSTPSSAPDTSSSVPSGDSSSADTTNKVAVPTPRETSGSVPEGDIGTAEAKAEAAAKQEQVREEIRKLKGKVNGREVEWTEEEAVRRLQMESAADEKFRQAAEKVKQVEMAIQMMRDDPASVLSQLGVDIRKFAEEHLGRELQRELMSPEERELHDLREWKRQQEEQQQAAQQEQMTKAQQAELQRQQQRIAQDYDVKISEVLSQSNLPKTAKTVKAVAQMMYSALEKGYELDIPTAVDMVKQDYTTSIQDLVGGLDGDHLVNMLGPDLVRKIRKHDLAAIRKKLEAQSPAAMVEQANKPAAQPRREKEDQYLRPDEWKEMIRKKAGL